MTSTEEFVPKFFDEASQDDPRQFAAPALTAWPQVGKMQPFPAPNVLIPYHSEFLHQMGFRWHPELQTLFKVRDPKVGHRFVSKEEYDELAALEVSPEESFARDEMTALLEKINPEMAADVANMTPEQRAHRVAQMAPEVEASMAQLARLQAVMKQEVEANDHTGRTDNSEE